MPPGQTNNREGGEMIREMRKRWEIESIQPMTRNQNDLDVLKLILEVLLDLRDLAIEESRREK